MKHVSQIIALGIAVCAGALAQQPPPGAPPAVAGTPPAAKGFGSLEGRAENALTGEPIRKANIVLRPMSGAGSGGMTMSMAPPAPYTAATDAAGKFRIESVEAGAYNMMAERQGFVRQQYGARQNSMMGTAIRVAAGQELKDLTVKMTPQAIVTGRVLDEEGELIARVQVQVMRRRFFQGKQQLMPMGGAQSIDTGEFRIADLAPGRYWISASYRGGRMMMFGEGPARNTAGQPEEEYVTTYYPNSVDQTGARAIDLQAGQALSGIDIQLRKARVFRIRGKVNGTPQPPLHMRVMAVPRERGAFMGPFGGGGGMVKEDGTFEIGGVSPGVYHVIAVPAQGVMNTVGKVAVDVGRSDVEKVELTLVAGTNVTGSIRLDTDAAKLQQAQGKKTSYAAVRIQLMPMEGMNFNNPGINAKEDGAFAIENAGAEKYRVGVYNVPQGTWLKSIRAGDFDVLENGIDLSAGAPAPVEVTLAAGVGQITGKVQDARQQAVSGGTVTLIPDPFKADRNDLFRVTNADQTGQFTMPNVPPGDYKLIAWEDVEPGLHMDPEFLKTHEGKMRKVTIKADGQAQLNLEQVPAEATKLP